MFHKQILLLHFSYKELKRTRFKLSYLMFILCCWMNLLVGLLGVVFYGKLIVAPVAIEVIDVCYLQK